MPPDFTPGETGNRIGPVNRNVAARAVNDDESRLPVRIAVKQTVKTTHVAAEHNHFFNQVFPEVFETGHKFFYWVTHFQVPIQGPGNGAIVVADQVDDKTPTKIGFDLAIESPQVPENGHVSALQPMVKLKLTACLFFNLAVLNFNHLSWIDRVPVTDSFLSGINRLAG